MRGRRSLWLLLVLLLAACPDGGWGGESRIKRGDALQGLSGSTQTLQLPPNSVALATADLVKTTKDVTLLSVRPESIPRGVDLLDVRATFLVRKGPGVVVVGFPGNLCTNEWPAKDLGPTEPIKGLAIRAGSRVSVNWYVRFNGESGEIRGVIYRYKVGRTVYEQRSEGIVFEVPPGAPTQDHCATPSFWFGTSESTAPYKVYEQE